MTHISNCTVSKKDLFFTTFSTALSGFPHPDTQKQKQKEKRRENVK